MQNRVFDVRFDLMTISANEMFWYASICSVGWGDWDGSLFHIEKGYRFDVLWLRNAWLYQGLGEWVKGKLNVG